VLRKLSTPVFLLAGITSGIMKYYLRRNSIMEALKNVVLGSVAIFGFASLVSGTIANYIARRQLENTLDKLGFYEWEA
jgi:ABC-type transporter Mla maintaining outer membrane lipid asymmetry permease subunit MlaE